MEFILFVVAAIGLLAIIVSALLLAAAIIINARADDAPMLSLLTGEPVDTGAPAPVYPIELARRRRNNLGGAA